MNDLNSIYVWVEQKNSDKVSILPSMTDMTHSVIELTADTLAANLQNFLKTFNKSLERQEADDSLFEIESIDLNLAINAQGGLELIGKLSSGVTTSIKVRLVRKTK